MTTTATDWLNNHSGDLEILDKMLLDSGVSANIVTQYPDWMKKDIANQLTESFSQPYWREISETTLGDAEKYIRQGLDQGWSIRRMADSMSGSFMGSTAKYAKMRATRIARTESGNALNGARKASMDQAKEELPNEVSDFMRALWHSVLGDTTRDSHAFLDGVPADEEGMWTLAGVRIPWPAHYTLPAGQKINCQCTIIQSYGMQPDEAKKLIEEGAEREREAAKPKPKPKPYTNPVNQWGEELVLDDTYYFGSSTPIGDTLKPRDGVLFLTPRKDIAARHAGKLGGEGHLYSARKEDLRAKRLLVVKAEDIDNLAYDPKWVDAVKKEKFDGFLSDDKYTMGLFHSVPVKEVKLKPRPVVPKPKPKPVPVPKPAEIRENKITALEKLIVNNKKEVGIVVDSKGNEVFRRVGETNKVTFSEKDLKRLKGKTLTHNHPPVNMWNGIIVEDVPLTGQDGFMMVENGIFEIRAVNSHHTYSIRSKRGKILDAKAISTTWNRQLDIEQGKAAKQIAKQIRAGKMTETQGIERLSLSQTESMHRAWKTTANSAGLDYKRIKTP